MRKGQEPIPFAGEKAEAAIGYVFRDKQLLSACFTHKSYTNLFGGENNERLEFLGDAVLEFCVTEELYLRSSADEGALTEYRQKLVSQAALEQAAERAGIKRFLRYMGSEHNVGGKTASNLFEAVVGGIYLDGGIEPVRDFLHRFLEVTTDRNYKTLLQEYVQERTKHIPDYSVREEDGGYCCLVRALGEEACGRGESKKAAETAAAKELYQILSTRQKH